MQRKSAERAWLKGFTGAVTDISFAHVATVLLGVVDEIGSMHIYEITESDSGTIQYP